MPLAADGYGLLPIDEVTGEDLLIGFHCGKQHLDEFLSGQALDWPPAATQTPPLMATPNSPTPAPSR